MDDIAEMLRAPTGCVPPTKWELEGATEIDRLRAALSEIVEIASRRLSGTSMQTKAGRFDLIRRKASRALTPSVSE